MKRRIWFERSFELGLPLEAFPEVLERLRGTPLRVEERISKVPSRVLAARDSGRWSAQEHLGHLIDLEELWTGRLDDFQGGSDALRPADLENRATWEADHNSRSVVDLLDEFRRLRGEMVARLESMSDRELTQSALHPRLNQPMTVVDLLFFVAEHDDHHLASITELATAAEEAQEGEV